MFRILFLTLYLFIFVFIANAQVSFTAKAPSEAEEGRPVRVEFKVNNNDAEEFVAPSFEGFDVLSGPSQSRSSSYQFINGKATSSSSLTITYLLAPQKKGTLQIGAATISVGDKKYQTKPLTINVVEATQQNGNSGGNSRSSASQNSRIQTAGTKISNTDLRFMAVPGRKKVYEQQAVRLTYKGLARVGVGLSGLSISKTPDFQGFYVEQFPEKDDAHSETIDNVLYKAFTCLDYLLIPQKSGQLVIRPIQFNCKVAQQQAILDPFDAFFNGGGMVMVDVQRSAPGIKLEVLPLPAPKPANFTGGVGNFTLSSRILENVVKSNDVATLRLTVSGVGNMKLLQAPTVEFPSDFETYPSKITQNLTPTSDGLKGTITFDYTFVPRNKGNYVVPAVGFSYFDPADEQYHEVLTDSIFVQVQQGTKRVVQDHIKKQTEDILPIITAEHSSPYAPPFIGTWSYYLLLAALLLVFISSVMLWKRRQRLDADVEGKVRKGAKRKVSKHLKRVAALRNSTLPGATFYAELARAIQCYFSEKYGVSEHLSTDALIDALRDKKISEEHLTALHSILSECEFQQFSGKTDPAMMDELLAKSETLISNL